MKPTPEQLKDPKWWAEHAPDGATHYKEGDAFDNAGWYDFSGKEAKFMFLNSSEQIWLSTMTVESDVSSIITKRPTHSVDATEKVGQKHDQGKPMMSLVPPAALLEVAKVMTFGANKYSLGNWQHVDDLHRRYTDAALRHINAYQRGEKLDDESKLHHLAHAVCCLMFMLETDLNAATRD